MKNKTNSRRDFIKKATIGTFASIGIPEILSASMATMKIREIELRKNQTILFQGDSITDAGRDREDSGYNNAGNLGSGYVLLAAASLLRKYAELELRIFNKGISGNKVFQLTERWNSDCLQIKPDILSILIGVNDFWHKLNGNYSGTIDTYRKDYISLLENTRNTLPDVKLIICEPFAVSGIKGVDAKWYPDFLEYQKSSKEIAAKFNAVFIPFQSVFDEAVKKAPGWYWTGDGVHPSLAGAQLMAKAWLKAIK